MKTLLIEIERLNKSLPLPKYETSGSAGVDIYANITKNIHILANNREAIPTGIKIKIPEGFEAQIRPRSGLASKHGITVLNSPGTIDSDFRGEIKVILYNSSKETFIIEHGMRIAQMVIAPIYKAIFQEAEINNDTERGSSGFGSTGINSNGNNNV